MTLENRLGQNTQEKPLSLLGGRLVPVKIGEGVWAYQEGEGTKNQQLAIDASGRIVATKNAKDICSKKNQSGVSLKIEKSPEGKLSLSASYSDGGGVVSFLAFHHIDPGLTGLRGVIAFVSPLRSETKTLLELERGEVVLIPFSKGGIIITTDKELMKPQNRGIIEGRLKMK